jgi:Fe-S-cluster-containing hydrogenase component 2
VSLKNVKQVVEIVDENCTGCYRCERACPTGAIAMVGPKKEALAVVTQQACIACFRCIDVCDDDAIDIAELDEPRMVRTSAKTVDPQVLAKLCEKAGMSPNQVVCLCSSTKVKELAAAVLSGASTFEELALATGAASGCLLYCSVPMRRVLAAHVGEIDDKSSRMRRYDTDKVLLDIPEDAADAYPLFALRKEQHAVRRRNEARKAREATL